LGEKVVVYPVDLFRNLSSFKCWVPATIVVFHRCQRQFPSAKHYTSAEFGCDRINIIRRRYLANYPNLQRTKKRLETTTKRLAKPTKTSLHAQSCDKANRHPQNASISHSAKTISPYKDLIFNLCLLMSPHR